MSTIITTDSGSNPRDISNMAPCIIVDSNDNNYYDMKKISDSDIPVISNIEVFERAFSGEKFLTAAPNINDLLSLMRPYIEKGDKVIHLAMSSGISAGSVNGAKVAADILNEAYGDSVTVIDTLTGGCGGTIINDYANRLANEGLPYEEIIKNILEIRKKILATFYISQVEGFVNSGRAPKEARLFDKLGFRYRVDVNELGKLGPKLPPYRGSIKTCFNKYLKTLINDNNKDLYDENYIALLITRLKELNVDEIKDYIKSLNYFNECFINEVPFYGAISSYGVEDQVGVALIKK